MLPFFVGTRGRPELGVTPAQAGLHLDASPPARRSRSALNPGPPACAGVTPWVWLGGELSFRSSSAGYCRGFGVDS